ncbi:hypothetical protein JAAARDRAFT_60403 [Jaapia argillacea MUCL 33604]|uniref:BZIP domain-containing protein n=1 Tax=Jaapia argillacea MUCL 33604 TaxID=933084 RepID=A0A067PX99_9AGAM|nr:hypothetical protein JAAARDRAFT_60403 [Jaapia argillacea MUCL 33604]
MESFNGVPSLWDLSQQSVSFSQLPDDDFLALLQKQFPSPVDTSHPFELGGTVSPDGVDPQNLTRFSVVGSSPATSDESSPSPPSPNSAHTSSRSRRQSTGLSTQGPAHGNSDHGDLKRKASEEDFEEGPSRKTAHPDTAANGKKGSARRKSTGNPHHDESRLLKRKEQNRAAQRAFRERKEKHVRDLEDKVAALEAKNAVAQSENENLRDLLTRLQSENMQLRQASFTFNVPSPAASRPPPPVPVQSNPKPAPNDPLYHALQHYAFNFSPPAESSRGQPSMIPVADNFDFNSLTTFDPSLLNAMDDSPVPQTATDGAMQLDFGFGQRPDGAHIRSPYKTIASNPLFTSFAEPMPDYDMNGGGQFNNNGHQMFDFNSFGSWPSTTPSYQPSNSQDAQSLDELFGGNFLGTQGQVDYAALARSPVSISPISHANGHVSTTGSTPVLSSKGSPGDSSSASSISSPLTPLSTAINNNPSASDSCGGSGKGGCPKTKAELAAHIANQGPSPFVDNDMLGLGPNTPGYSVLRKSSDDGESMVVCTGSSIPRTEQNESNIEVLSAWRTITSDPNFKDVDINELCSEFTKKAKCDGKKVVLEPQGVQCILDKLTAKKQTA